MARRRVMTDDEVEEASMTGGSTYQGRPLEGEVLRSGVRASLDAERRGDTARISVELLMDITRRMGFTYNPVTDRLIINNARNRRSILSQMEKQRVKTLVLISCSQSKRASGDLTPVRDLYCSPTFKSSVDWAERRGLPWKVLSAKHGALEPDEEIADYDMRLTTPVRPEWIDSVGTAIYDEWLFARRRAKNRSQRSTLVLLAGDDYARPVNEIVERNKWSHGKLNALASELQVTQPLKGMQLAERRRWLEEDEALFGAVPSQPLSTREAREALDGGGTVWFKDWTDSPEDYGGPDYPVEDPADLHDLDGYRDPPLILSEPQQNPED